MTFTNISWPYIDHNEVGGTSTIRAWFGHSSSNVELHQFSPTPVYNCQNVGSILKFAPREQHIIPINQSSLPTSTHSTVYKPVSISETHNIWASNGILPLYTLQNHSPMPQILCPSPFSITGISLCDFTTIETVCLMDLPVQFESRLTRLLTPYLTSESPILNLIPTKILVYGLWIAGILVTCPNNTPNENNLSTGRGSSNPSSDDSNETNSHRDGETAPNFYSNYSEENSSNTGGTFLSNQVGVDISPIFEEELINEDKRVKWERYTWCAMRLKMSPYQVVRATLIAKEFLTGFPWMPNNPFAFTRVVLNLPGSSNHKPGQPWFYFQKSNNKMAAILAIYVNDQRIHASSEEEAFQAAPQVASRESYLGIQDAARKQRQPSQQAGAWAGSIIHTNNNDVRILVSKERWFKTKFLRTRPNHLLDTEELFSDRGFLVYITRTYDILTPYLKGIHLTLDAWRCNRDEDGWKIYSKYSDRTNSTNHNFNSSEFTSYGYPKQLRPVSCLKSNLAALHTLTESDKPPVLIIHTDKIYVARYIFGDASASGFGLTSMENDNLAVEYGTWTEKGSESTSNFREFSNFVCKLEKDTSLGKLAGVELFIFTDNATTESAFHNRTSSSKTLSDLILIIRVIQIKWSTRIHIIHIAGSRMIEQGTDALSRGNLCEGVLLRKNMLSFIQIAKTAIERSPLLLNWIREWTNMSTLIPLKAEEWHWKGQCLLSTPWTNIDGMELPQESDQDTFLWVPPPCLADVALEYLRKSILKHPGLFHIFICPKVMTYAWQKHLLKNCDFLFYVDAKVEFWNKNQHESILIALFLPSLHCPPWSFRRSKRVLEMEE